MDAELFNEWFHLADTNHDGVISGAEAVTFFQRSNLSQDTLFQVNREYYPSSVYQCHLKRRHGVSTLV